MALKKEFQKTVLDRCQRDPEFKKELLEEFVNELLYSCNLKISKIVLRRFIKITKKIDKNS